MSGSSSEASPPFLPYGRQTVTEEDIAAVAAVLRSDWLTQGPAVERFESRLAAVAGARHAVACANGTAALHLAMLASGLGDEGRASDRQAPRDAVIVPSLTFLATANAARLTGAEVVFADVDPMTGLMGPDQAAAAAARAATHGWRVRAVAPVHLAGQCADMAGLGALARHNGWAVIEDGCHALGTVGADGPVGGCRQGDMTAFSFHPVKTVAAGEGGAVTTNDDSLARRLRLFRNHGMERDTARLTDESLFRAADGGVNPWVYEMPVPGFNYRLSDLHAALADSQLQRLDALVARRQDLVERYDAALAGMPPALKGIVRPLARVAGCRPGWHLYGVLIDFTAAGHDRAAVMAALRQRGIGTQVHYIPVHRQPYYRGRYGDLSLPGVESYYAGCLSLPLFPAMEEGDVERVVGALAAVLAA